MDKELLNKTFHELTVRDAAKIAVMVMTAKLVTDVALNVSFRFAQPHINRLVKNADEKRKLRMETAETEKKFRDMTDKL